MIRRRAPDVTACNAMIKSVGRHSVSVIIPVFNRARSIEHAVRSVLEQTVPILEVIVVDDGSTDATGAAVAAIEDSRIRYVYQANGGAGAARNRGLDTAIGDWVGFLDSDDWWVPERVASAMALIDANPMVEIQQANRLHVYDDGRIDDGLKADFQALEDPIRLISGFVVKTSAVMIKRDLIERLSLRFPTDQKTCEDYHLFWRAIIFANDIGFSRRPDVMIRASPDSLSRGKSDAYLQRDNVKTLIEVLAWARAKQAPSIRIAAVTEHLHWQLRNYFVTLLQSRQLWTLLRYVLIAARQEGWWRCVRGLLSALREFPARAPVQSSKQVLESPARAPRIDTK